MEKYPHELKVIPTPLVALLGGSVNKNEESSQNVDASQPGEVFISCLRSINLQMSPILNLLHFSFEHRFPDKKEVREKQKIATFPAVTRQVMEKDFEGAVPKGILKTEWLRKHHELLPSVVVPFFEFDPRLANSDWSIQEAIIGDEVDNLRRSLYGRECQIILVLLQPFEGNTDRSSNSSIPKSSHHVAVEERLASLKRRTELDAKNNIYLIRVSNIHYESETMKKLESVIRHYAAEYYRSQARRVKKYKKSIDLLCTSKRQKNPSNQLSVPKSMILYSMLHIRHYFKIAHFHEFRRNAPKVLQYYDMAYKGVLSLPHLQVDQRLQNSSSPLKHYRQGGSVTASRSPKLIDSELEEFMQVVRVGQVKEVADYINFKICYHHIISSNNMKLAVEQFQLHIKNFLHLKGDQVNEIDIIPHSQLYEHWGWISSQYEVFAELLSEAISIRGHYTENFAHGNGPLVNVSNSHDLDSVIYTKPYLYYSIAAKYAIMRRRAAAVYFNENNSVNGSTQSVDFTKLPTSLSENNYQVQPSKFVGGDPILQSFSTEHQHLSSNKLLEQYLDARERSVPHSTKIIFLLEKSMAHLYQWIGKEEEYAHKNSQSQLFGSNQYFQRLKNHLLVQLGMEKMVNRQYADARLDLEKAKKMYSIERWWRLVLNILKQLLHCSQQQGDIPARIDYTLQLLSPKLQEYLSQQERSQLQQSLVEVEGDMSTGDKEHMISFPFDRLRPLFNCHVRFDVDHATIGDNVSMALHCQSFFPDSLTFSAISICFTDESYNRTIQHQESSEGYQDYVENLSFKAKELKIISIPLSVRNGQQRIVHCHEIRLVLPFTSSGSLQHLMFNVTTEAVSSPIVRASKPTLKRQNSLLHVDGIIPSMGQGPGSPSFAKQRRILNQSKRESITSLAEQLKQTEEENGTAVLHSFFLDKNAESDVSNSSNVVEPLTMFDGLSTASPHPNGYYLIILPPKPLATIKMTLTQCGDMDIQKQHHDQQHRIYLLAGNFHQLVVEVEAGRDGIQDGVLEFYIDDSISNAVDGRSSKEKQSFFYESHSKTPIEMRSDSNGGLFYQPSRSFKVRPARLEPGACIQFSDVDIRANYRCKNLRIVTKFTYTGSRGLRVEKLAFLEVDCLNPFQLSCGVLSDYPILQLNKQSRMFEDTNIAESTNKLMIVGKQSCLQISLSCSSDILQQEQLYLIACELESSDSTSVSAEVLFRKLQMHRSISLSVFYSDILETVKESGFFKPCEQKPLVISSGDEYVFQIRMVPKTPIECYKLGKIKLTWKRSFPAAVENGKDTDLNNSVISYLSLGDISFVESPFLVEVTNPGCGKLGHFLPICLAIQNKSIHFHTLHIKVSANEYTHGFLLSGNTDYFEYCQPKETLSCSFGVIPTITGHLTLPQIEIILVDTNVSLVVSTNYKEIFIEP